MKLVFFAVIALVFIFLFSSFFVRSYYFIWKVKYVSVGILIGAVFGYFAGKKS
jgi:hypothetical protein